MESPQLAAVLNLLRECQEALASGRAVEGAQLVDVAEAELAALLGRGSTDQRQRSPAHGAQGLHAYTHYSGPLRRRTDPSGPDDGAQQ